MWLNIPSPTLSSFWGLQKTARLVHTIVSLQRYRDRHLFHHDLDHEERMRSQYQRSFLIEHLLHSFQVLNYIAWLLAENSFESSQSTIASGGFLFTKATDGANHMNSYQRMCLVVTIKAQALHIDHKLCIVIITTRMRKLWHGNDIKAASSWAEAYCVWWTDSPSVRPARQLVSMWSTNEPTTH